MESASMAPVVDELQRILSDFNARYHARVSAVISGSGIPIAWAAPDGGLQLDNFATLAATLLGSAEAIYTSLSESPPKRVVIESENGMLVAEAVGTKAFVIAVMPARTEDIERGLEGVATDLRGVLRGRH